MSDMTFGGFLVKYWPQILIGGALIANGAVAMAKVTSLETDVADLKARYSMYAVEAATAMQRFEQMERDSGATKLDIKEIRASIGLLQLQSAKICVKLQCER